jgi:hypothetical protein
VKRAEAEIGLGKMRARVEELILILVSPTVVGAMVAATAGVAGREGVCSRGRKVTSHP